MAFLNQKVALEGIRFFAFHGFYPEEQITGCEFIVDIFTESQIYGSGDDQLGNTVNYERLFEIAKLEMAHPRKLIETVAHAMLDRIRHEFLAAKSIRICIHKMNPPLAGEVEKATVELIYNR